MTPDWHNVPMTERDPRTRGIWPQTHRTGPHNDTSLSTVSRVDHNGFTVVRTVHGDGCVTTGIVDSLSQWRKGE